MVNKCYTFLKKKKWFPRGHDRIESEVCVKNVQLPHLYSACIVLSWSPVPQLTESDPYWGTCFLSFEINTRWLSLYILPSVCMQITYQRCICREFAGSVPLCIFSKAKLPLFSSTNLHSFLQCSSRMPISLYKGFSESLWKMCIMKRNYARISKITLFFAPK